MAVLLEYKCPSCGGALSFDSNLQKMKCPYCDTEFEVAALQELDEALKSCPEEDMSWQTQAGTVWQEGELQELRSYVCSSCGGEIVGDSTTAATACPYCDNPVVISEQFAQELRPDLVIPFKLDKAAAKQAFLKHLSGKPLLPKQFKTEHQLEQIKGLYVPFWLFDTQADATIQYHATRVRHWSDSRYDYTETSHYHLLRAGKLAFEGVPVDGSEKMPNELMEAIEPYDLSQAVDFQSAYLAGYFADKYDVSAEDSVQRANQRIRASTEKTFRSTCVGYATVTSTDSSIRLEKSRARYALYPVWLMTANYKDQRYTFAMNAQTGKFVGNLPMDRGAFWAWLLGVSAGAAAAALAIAALL